MNFFPAWICFMNVTLSLYCSATGGIYYVHISLVISLQSSYLRGNNDHNRQNKNIHYQTLLCNWPFPSYIHHTSFYIRHHQHGSLEWLCQLCLLSYLLTFVSSVKPRINLCSHSNLCIWNQTYPFSLPQSVS